MRSKKKGTLLLIGFLFITNAFCQDQRVADSLSNIYQQGGYNDSTKMDLLFHLSFNEMQDLNLSLKYAEDLIDLSERKNDKLYQHRGYFQKGNKKRLLGDLEEALAAYFKSAEAAESIGFTKGVGNAYGTIADIYSISNNHVNAQKYYQQAISILREINDSIPLASVLLNAGEDFMYSQMYDSAFIYFKESKLIFEKINYLPGKAYGLGNLGMVYANSGETDLAEQNLNEAIHILEGLGDYYPICVYLVSMADIYLEDGKNTTAVNYVKRSLNLATQYGLKEQIRDANLKLAMLYEQFDNTEESYNYYKNYILYKDSLNNIKTVQNLADLRTDFEVSQKQAEVDLLTQKRKNQRTVLLFMYIIVGLGTIILITLYWFYRSISKEKRKSEGLLLNILPAETAKELKLKGTVDAVKFDEVTVLFTDFVQFTSQAEQTDPEQLVKSIDFYFKAFDEITSKHGLEKIKTIGDSYMCACGLPKENKTHADNVVKAAKEMVEFVNKELHTKDGLCHFEVRIGIHSGPVVAGIVGIKKWQYDIWGDTVNIASRMESNSEPGRINISESTYRQINGNFTCEYRGEIEVKNRGILKMYFIEN